VTTLHDVGPVWPDAAKVINNFGVAIHRDDREPRPDLLDEGGPYIHTILDADAVRSHAPDLVAWYHDAIPTIERVVGAPVTTSPHESSDITAKLYPGGIGCQGWHRDTNPVTVLAYLTDTGSPTVIDLGTHRPCAEIHPQVGAVLVFPGRRLRHYVPATPYDRVTVSFNYYTLGDDWRPRGIDELAYGHHPERGHDG
jgi:hypothetical protein